MEKLKIFKKVLQHLFLFVFYSLLFYGGLYLAIIYSVKLTRANDPFSVMGVGVFVVFLFAIPILIISMLATYFILKKIGYSKKTALTPLLFYFIISLVLFFILTSPLILK